MNFFCESKLFWELVTPSEDELTAEREAARDQAHALGHDVPTPPNTTTNDASVVDEGVTSAATANDDDKSNDLRLTRDQRRRLLQFFSGSDTLPIEGLSSMRLTLQKNGTDKTRLVTASTCYNVLLLPDYADRRLLYKNLVLASEHSEGFTIA